jgi:hypothetical protein
LQLIRILRHPLREIPLISGPLIKATFQSGGAPLRERLEGLSVAINAVIDTLRDARRDPANDPIRRTRLLLRSEAEHLQEFEDQIHKEMEELLASALVEGTS